MRDDKMTNVDKMELQSKMYNVPFQEQHKHNHVKPVNRQGNSLYLCRLSAAEEPI